MTTYITRCPKCGSEEHTIRVQVEQTWEVDQFGRFQNVKSLFEHLIGNPNENPETKCTCLRCGHEYTNKEGRCVFGYGDGEAAPAVIIDEEEVQARIDAIMSDAEELEYYQRGEDM